MDDTNEMMLRVENLNKKNRKEPDGMLLSAVCFSFAKKGVHGILGPKGSSKTALLEILAGVDPDFEGSVCVADRTLGAEEALWKQKIGYLPQDEVLDGELTAEELMELYGRARGVDAERRARQIKEALDLVGLSDLRRRLVKNLSRGQRKKLTLAASLLGNPDLLLLDEPLSGLTVEERDELLDLIPMLGAMKTLLLATEQYQTACQLCEDIVLLSDGEVLAQGSFADLEERLREKSTTLPELYRSLCAAEREEDE